MNCQKNQVYRQNLEKTVHVDGLLTGADLLGVIVGEPNKVCQDSVILSDIIFLAVVVVGDDDNDPWRGRSFSFSLWRSSRTTRDRFGL